MLHKTVVGGYPRPAWLREKLLQIEGKQKKAGSAGSKVAALYDKATAEVIQEYESCGMDLITDGMLRWTDALASFCEGLDGIRMIGLTRFYDNNFYYRQPEVTDRVNWSKPVLVDDYLYARKCARKKVKCVLPGPYTLARLCKNSHYSNTEWLMNELSTAIASEAKALEQAGCGYIQIDEPSLVYDKELAVEASSIKNALDKIIISLSATTMLCTYFGGFTDNLSILLDAKYDAIGFDLVEGKENLKFLKEYPFKKDVALGVLNSRDIMMESPAEVKKTIKKAVSLTNAKNVYLSPNWGLELIPREYAVKKLKLLSSIAGSAGEGHK
jgi:5-methyltetrahydropteroyltriglutamate--homocysteine methyltransferase